MGLVVVFSGGADFLFARLTGFPGAASSVSGFSVVSLVLLSELVIVSSGLGGGGVISRFLKTTMSVAGSQIGNSSAKKSPGFSTAAVVSVVLLAC